MEKEKYGLYCLDNREENAPKQKEKFGLMKHGFCGTDEEQNKLLAELNDYVISSDKIKSFVDLAQYLNDVTEEEQYKIVKTTLKTKDNNDVIFWFKKEKDGKGQERFTRLEFGDAEKFIKRKEIDSHFAFGDIIFDKNHNANTFLKSIKEKALPEPWEWQSVATLKKQNLSILKSYIQFTFLKLKIEDANNVQRKIGLSTKGGSEIIAFNTNLMDNHLADILIAGEKVPYGNSYYLKNPYIAQTHDLEAVGIKTDELVPAKYFDNINEILFHADWKIVIDAYDKIEHVLQRKDERTAKNITIAQLTTAITFSKKMGQRNYKFIVPMYYPEQNRLQLLMPLYYDGDFSKKQPDGVLILTADTEAKCYIPETIIGLKEAYMDARLIVKPDTAWLDPNTI